MLTGSTTLVIEPKSSLGTKRVRPQRKQERCSLHIPPLVPAGHTQRSPNKGSSENPILPSIYHKGQNEPSKRNGNTTQGTMRGAV